MFGMFKEVFEGILLKDHSFIHEHDPLGYDFAKPFFMGTRFC